LGLVWVLTNFAFNTALDDKNVVVCVYTTELVGCHYVLLCLIARKVLARGVAALSLV
jgi:hypothetical protein